MKLNKKILSLLLAGALIMGLAACSGSGSGSGAGTESPQVSGQQSQSGGSSNEETVINVAVGSFATSSVYTAKEQFEADNPGITINVVEIPFGSLYEKLCTSFATNTAAYDIAIYPSNWLSEFIQGNSVIALDEYLTEKDNWDTLIDAYYDMQMYDGKCYAVPLDGDSIILYYRKDALENEEYRAMFQEKYGYELTVPTTWDQYIDVAEFFNGWDWDGDGELEQKFLPRRETEILLVLELFKIVQKADRAVDQGEDEHENMAVIALRHALPADGQADRRHRGDEHQAAHGRRALLAAVPCRTDLLDGLPRLDAAQERHEPRAHERAHGKADDERQDQFQRHFCFLLLSSISATTSRSSRWCLT